MKTTNRVLSAITAAAVLFTVGGMSACKDLQAELPVGTANPEFYKTPEAAVQIANNARWNFHLALLDFMLTSGSLTDEFYYRTTAGQSVGIFSPVIYLDQRNLPDETLAKTLRANMINNIRAYSKLQKSRARSFLGRAALQAYAPDVPAAVQGEMAAYEAFAEVMLADLYCAGIPLSTIELEGNYTYLPGSRTADVYTHAVALFDTAIALAASDAQVRHMASIGKGRALLALGRYNEARDAVSEVPVGYVFDLPVVTQLVSDAGVTTGENWADIFGNEKGWVANNEGTNGLDYFPPILNRPDTIIDPRIRPLIDTGVLCAVRPVNRCALLTHRIFRRALPPTRLKVATHIEARLIEAEALLQTGDAQYLTVLNTLRTNGTRTTTNQLIGVAPDTLRVIDTAYNAGTGGIADLAPLTDPGAGSPAARVNLLFRERAFWLYFRGIRQGDLRRLIRHYNRPQETVYPVGPHPVGTGAYRENVDIPIPAVELPNGFFKGCIARGE